MKPRDPWTRTARKLKDRLAKLGLDEHGRRRAMLMIWRVLEDAPGDLKPAYKDWPEAEISAAAEARFPYMQKPGFGFVPPNNRVELFRALAELLRALELLHPKFDDGRFPSNPLSLLVHDNLNDDTTAAYLLPAMNRLWRTPPPAADDFRAFSQRGLLHFRFIPRWVDNVPVNLVPGDRLGDGTPPKFGAALFKDLTFRSEQTPKTFRVTAIECPERDATVERALHQSAIERCVATVFPELTIDDATCTRIGDLLARAEWLDEPLIEESPAPRSPALVVAGSWHRPRAEGGYANVAPVLNRFGDVILRHHKRRVFNDAGRKEAIVVGSEYNLLMCDDCLIAIAICLDFADLMVKPHPYDRLDVDLVLVPSCGNDQTMISHLNNARDLAVHRRCRAMVVQQAYKAPPHGQSDALGFVLPPTADLPDGTQSLARTDRWILMST